MSSLKIETAKAAAPKLLSAVGVPKRKAPPKGSHILFPYASKYRSPRRYKWWDSERTEFPRHTHQKIWLPPHCLTLPIFAVQGPAARAAAEEARKTIDASKVEEKRRQSTQDTKNSDPEEERRRLSSVADSAAESAVKWLSSHIFEPHEHILYSASRNAAYHRVPVRSPLKLLKSESVRQDTDFDLVSVGPFVYAISKNQSQDFPDSMVLSECLHTAPSHGVGCLLQRSAHARKEEQKEKKDLFRLQKGRYAHQNIRGTSMKIPKATSTHPVVDYQPPFISEDTNREDIRQNTKEGSYTLSHADKTVSGFAFLPLSAAYNISSFKGFIMGHYIALNKQAKIVRKNSRAPNLGKTHWKLLGIPINGCRWVYRPPFAITDAPADSI